MVKAWRKIDLGVDIKGQNLAEIENGPWVGCSVAAEGEIRHIQRSQQAIRLRYIKSYVHDRDRHTVSRLGDERENVLSFTGG